MHPTFEVLFGIPDHHRLLLARSLGRGGVIHGTYWTHEEVDPSESVVARYESYEERDGKGHVQCGWRKYDSRGHLVDGRTLVGGWSQMRLEADRTADATS